MSKGRREELGPEAFEQLLVALAPDREAAGSHYLVLRGQLTDYFAWQGCASPDELADQTLNRLARKLAEGEPIQSPNRFAFGIARLIVREDRRARLTRDNALRNVRILQTVPAPQSQAIVAVQDCLARLDPQSRALIETYYTEEDRAALAKQMGLSLNALRNRALRIREKLFLCFHRGRDIQ